MARRGCYMPPDDPPSPPVVTKSDYVPPPLSGYRNRRRKLAKKSLVATLRAELKATRKALEKAQRRRIGGPCRIGLNGIPVRYVPPGPGGVYDPKDHPWMWLPPEEARPDIEAPWEGEWAPGFSPPPERPPPQPRKKKQDEPPPEPPGPKTWEESWELRPWERREFARYLSRDE